MHNKASEKEPRPWTFYDPIKPDVSYFFEKDNRRLIDCGKTGTILT